MSGRRPSLENILVCDQVFAIYLKFPRQFLASQFQLKTLNNNQETFQHGGLQKSDDMFIQNIEMGTKHFF